MRLKSSLREIESKLKDIKDLLSPIEVEHIEKIDLYELIDPIQVWLNTHFVFAPGYKWDIRDRYVWATDLETTKKIILLDWLPRKLPYIIERRDCDNFAINIIAFFSMRYDITNLAYVESDVHAFNFLIFRDEFFILEPQTGGVFKNPAETGYAQYYRRLDDVRL